VFTLLISDTTNISHSPSNSIAQQRKETGEKPKRGKSAGSHKSKKWKKNLRWEMPGIEDKMKHILRNKACGYTDGEKLKQTAHAHIKE